MEMKQMVDFVREHFPQVIAAVVLIGAWLALRTRPTRFASLSAVEGAVGEGQPVVMEFFSNA